MNLPLFMEGVKIQPGLSNQQASVTASSDRVNLALYHRVAALVTVRQAGGTATTLTFSKATTDGTSVEDTANIIENWWKLEDVTVGTTAATWTKGAEVASGSTISTSVSATLVSYYLIDINADVLPEAGVDYKFVEINTAGGNAANYLDVMWFLYNPRYAQAALPSAQT